MVVGRSGWSAEMIYARGSRLAGSCKTEPYNRDGTVFIPPNPAAIGLPEAVPALFSSAACVSNASIRFGVIVHESLLPSSIECFPIK